MHLAFLFRVKNAELSVHKLLILGWDPLIDSDLFLYFRRDGDESPLGTPIILFCHPF
jgi:hypothetical protein